MRLLQYAAEFFAFAGRRKMHDVVAHHPLDAMLLLACRRPATEFLHLQRRIDGLLHHHGSHAFVARVSRRGRDALAPSQRTGVIARMLFDVIPRGIQGAHALIHCRLSPAREVGIIGPEIPGWMRGGIGVKIFHEHPFGALDALEGFGEARAELE